MSYCFHTFRSSRVPLHLGKRRWGQETDCGCDRMCCLAVRPREVVLHPSSTSKVPLGTGSGGVGVFGEGEWPTPGRAT